MADTEAVDEPLEFDHGEIVIRDAADVHGALAEYLMT